MARLIFGAVKEILETYPFIVVGNCEGSETLPYPQTNNLAGQCFIDIDRNHKTPVPETKQCITQGTAGSISFKFTSVSLTTQDLWSKYRGLNDSVHTAVCVTAEDAQP